MNLKRKEVCLNLKVRVILNNILDLIRRNKVELSNKRNSSFGSPIRNEDHNTKIVLNTDIKENNSEIPTNNTEVSLTDNETIKRNVKNMDKVNLVKIKKKPIKKKYAAKYKQLLKQG